MNPETTTAFDAKTFRRALGRFATGVTVVTVRHGSRVHGMTANAFSSLSLDPPLVLVCVDRKNDTYPLLEAAGSFGVNILSREQEGISDRYAGRGRGSQDTFEGVALQPSRTGVPLLAGCLAALECRLERIADGGDHGIFIGRVLAVHLGAEDARPLLFFASRYWELGEVKGV